MQIEFGSLLRISVRHTYVRGRTFYFRRPVPKDLRGKIGRTSIKKNLRTSDPIQAAKLVALIDKHLESEWKQLRGFPNEETDAPPSLAPSVDELAALGLAEYELRQSLREAPMEDFPASTMPSTETTRTSPPVADDHDAGKHTVTDAMDFYFQRHEKGGSNSFQRMPRIAVAQFTQLVGDKPAESVTRADVHQWMTSAVSKGHSKGTILRRLSCLKAIFSMFIREKELDIPNRFEKHVVPGSAKKAEKRQTFSKENLRIIQEACKETDDDVRWATAMLSDTCSRLAEIVGLRLSDLVLDVPIPHIIIEEHAARSLKTPDSKRVVPLVGMALWAAKRVKSVAAGEQVYAFPRYIKNGRCNALSASATINKWLLSKGMKHTTHEFRHTMADRLRDVGCPEEVRNQIGGWSRLDMAQRYGQGTSLERLREWLDRVVL